MAAAGEEVIMHCAFLLELHFTLQAFFCMCFNDINVKHTQLLISEPALVTKGSGRNWNYFRCDDHM